MLLEANLQATPKNKLRPGKSINFHEGKILNKGKDILLFQNYHENKIKLVDVKSPNF